MSKPALPPPSPTHLERLIVWRPKDVRTAMVFSRAGDTRAHPWTFALFAFTTFTEKRKIRTIFNPKTEDKNRAKKCPTLPQKRRRFSQKRRRFLKKRGRFSWKCRRFSWNTRKSSQLNQDTSSSQPQKSMERVPSPSNVPPSIYFFYRKHRKSVSHSAPKSPISALDFPFSPAFS